MTTTPSLPLSAEQLDKLEALARAATPQNLDTAQDSTKPTGYIECPDCGGEGTVELTADYCNYDGKAMGVQFYGIGPEHVAAEAFFRAANPATILALIAQARTVTCQPQAAMYQPTGAMCQPAQQATVSPGELLFDAEFLSKRLTRVAKLVGARIPEHFTHEQVAAVAGTVLGEIARLLEARASSAKADPSMVSLAAASMQLEEAKRAREDRRERLGIASPASDTRAAVLEEAEGAHMRDVVADLREYAGNPGYSHNDYADTMRAAAHCIEALRSRFWSHDHLAAPTAAIAEADAKDDGAAWREGVLMAVSVLISTHDQPTMGADVLNELGLRGVDCSALDDFDKRNLRKVQKKRKSLNLRGLTNSTQQAQNSAKGSN